MLRHCGNAGSQAAGEAHKDDFDRCCCIVLSGKYQRMICFEFKFRSVHMLFAEAEISLY